MKKTFQTPVMETVSFSVTDILCSSVDSGPVAPPLVPATSVTTSNGDNYRDDIF